MKEMRRLLSFLLVLAMVVGFVPATAFAAEVSADFTGNTGKAVDAALFFSDLHTSQNDYKDDDIKRILGGLDNFGLKFSTVNSVGDAFSSNNSSYKGYTSTINKSFQEALGYSDFEMFYAWSDHDRGADIENFTGLLYGDANTNYYIYTISMSDMSSAERYGQPSTFTESKLSDFTAAVEAMDHTKPLFIISHMPLHVRRNDNQYADEWYEVISKAAEKMDIAFFWGHNHTSETSADTAAYYVAKDGTEKLIVAGGPTEVPNFTYLNAGYMSPASTGSTASSVRQEVVTAVTIYEDKLVYTLYDEDGIYGGNYAMNETVTREFAAKTPIQLVVTGANEYTVGDVFAMPTVAVKYSDDSTKALTEGYTVTGAPAVDATGKLTTAGEYTLTYSCTLNGYKAEAQFAVTVKAAETGTVTVESEAGYMVDGEFVPNSNMVYATGTGLTGVTAVWDDDADVSAFQKNSYVAYKVDLAGYTEGDAVTLTFELVMDSTAEGLVVYDGKGNPVEFTATEETADGLISVVVTVTMNSASETYIIGKLGASEGAVITGLEIGNLPEVTNYILMDEIVDNDIYLDITGLVINAVYSDGVRIPLSWNQFKEEKDGYALSFDINVAGVRTVTVTYGGFETSFQVTVYDSVVVNKDADETVAAALAEVLTGEFVARDITLVDYIQGTKVRVVMPAPEKANVVYHVAEDGTLNKIEGAIFQDGFAIFDTDHFSTYVAGQAALPGNTVVVENVPFTTITTEKVTVYKRVTTPVSGQKYLIVNSDTGNGYGLDGDNTGYNTDTFTAAAGATYYQDWDDTTKTGTQYTFNGTYAIVAESDAYLWTATKSGNNWKFSSETAKLGVSYNSLNFNTDSDWTLNNNKLTSGRNLYCNGGRWSVDRNNSSYIYFYEPVELTKVTEKTDPQDVTVGIAITVNGEASSTMEAKNLVNGDKVSLGTAFTTDPTGYTVPTNGTYTWEVTSDPSDVISSVENGLVTFTGKVGKGTVKVSYTFTVNGKEYTISNTLEITTTSQTYNMAFSTTETQVELGVAKKLPLVAKNADGKTINADNVTWIVDNPTVLEIDDGVAIGLVVGGETDVTATWTDPNKVTHTDTIHVKVVEREPDYTLDILDSNGTVIDRVISLERVVEGTTYGLGAKITKDGIAWTPEKVQYVDYATRTGGNFTPVKGTLYWTVNDDDIVDSVSADGLVTFTGDKDGLVNVSVYYCGTDSTEWLYDTVTITVTSKDFYTPEDGAQHFPEYPNPGSININKTATAVGNFSQTGIAQIELYGNGIPQGKPLDVVLMLDHSNSMTDERMKATREAVKAFLRTITSNDDGSFNPNNNHRIYVGSFAGGNPEYLDTANERARHYFRIYEMTEPEDDGYQVLDSEEELNSLLAEIDRVYIKITSNTTAIHGTNTPYGTEYDQSLEKCYEMLRDSKEDGNQQFCVFMSDGIPNVYRYGEGTNDKTTSSTAMANMFTTSGNNRYASRGTGYHYEYWSSKMKSEGVTVFSVGLGLHGTNSSLNGANEAECERVSNFLLNDISGPANEKDTDRDTGSTISKLHTGTDYSKEGLAGKYFFSVTDADAETTMEKVFTGIATSIKAAATDVTIHDQITDAYELILDFPEVMIRYDQDATNSYKNPIPDQEFYIEVVNYELDDSYNRTGNVEELIRIYIDDQGAYYKENGERKSYASYNAETGEGVTVTFGTDGKVGNIVCKYFTYNAATKSFTWKTDQLSDDYQIALRYFVYLSDSLELLYDGDDTTQLPPQPYNTNTIAWMEYKNAEDKPCRQEFPVPQLTWNGAQVTYFFYLVNEDGLPVNKAGQVINFSNAVEVTQRYTEHVVWNGAMGVTSLDVELLASSKLPEYYSLYDQNTYFEVHVYQDELGEDAGDNYFYLVNTQAIDGNDDGKADTDYTTKVFMDKSSTKYDATGYYTKDGGQFVDADGKTVSSSLAASGFDFADLTVAFAVVWTPELQDDVVVVDFGLDVIIDVTTNDYLANNINGISATKAGYSSTAINVGLMNVENNAFGGAAINLGTANDEGIKTLTVSVAGAHTLRVHQNHMEFNEPVKFYYDSKISYVEDAGTTNERTVTGYMYSSVTVIPATTVYYEDSFLTFNGSAGNGVQTVKPDTLVPGQWYMEGTTINGTQDTDRPGDSKISFEVDADNVYGYDSAYTEMSEYSMGSAAMIHVDANSYGTAGFTFYGTGFDVISETSNMTGTIAVTVEDANGTIVKRTIVDTYYGYMLDPDNYDKITYTYWGVDENGNEKWSVATEVVPTSEVKDNDPKPTTGLEIGKTTYTVYKQRWITTTNDPNAVHQVPVIKIFGLPYGQYTATITATYNSFFDHTGTENEDGSKDGYDLYLDAIRIYDPAGTNKEANDAYIKDNEGYPVYKELRNMILDKGSFSVDANGNFTVPDNGVLGGMVFIDSNNATNVISDYTNYGPNNELYLAPGQAIAFNLNLTTDAMNALVDVQIGLKLANGANAAYEVYNVLAGGAQYKPMAGVAKTATEMYYSISDLRNGTIVIRNSGDAGILSVTNLKFTFKSQQTAEIAKETADGAKQVVVTNGEAATNAVKSLSYVTPSTPNFDPEAMDITFNRTNAEVGNNVIVTVTTSSDVKDLIVNGTVATNKMTSYLTGETTWSFTVPVVDNGSLKVTVVGYDANGEYTVPYSETVTVINMSGNQSDLLGKLFG